MNRCKLARGNKYHITTTRWLSIDSALFLQLSNEISVACCVTISAENIGWDSWRVLATYCGHHALSPNGHFKLAAWEIRYDWPQLDRGSGLTSNCFFPKCTISPKIRQRWTIIWNWWHAWSINIIYLKYEHVICHSKNVICKSVNIADVKYFPNTVKLDDQTMMSCMGNEPLYWRVPKYPFVRLTYVFLFPLFPVKDAWNADQKVCCRWGQGCW